MPSPKGGPAQPSLSASSDGPIQPSISIARFPAAVGQDCLGIRQFQQRLQSEALVGRLEVVGFADALADPVAKVARLLRCAEPIIKPVRHVRTVLFSEECSIDFALAPPGPNLER